MSEDTAIRELNAVHQQILERQFAAITAERPQPSDYSFEDASHYLSELRT